MFNSSYNPFSSFSIDTTSLSFKNYADYQKKPVNPLYEGLDPDFAAHLEEMDRQAREIGDHDYQPFISWPRKELSAEEIRIADEEFEKALYGEINPKNHYKFKKAK
jgi:hypothetical protein